MPTKRVVRKVVRRVPKSVARAIAAIAQEPVVAAAPPQPLVPEILPTVPLENPKPCTSAAAAKDVEVEDVSAEILDLKEKAIETPALGYAANAVYIPAVDIAGEVISDAVLPPKKKKIVKVVRRVPARILKAKPEHKSEPVPEAAPETEPETAPVPKPKHMPDSKPESKPMPAHETVSEPKPEIELGLGVKLEHSPIAPTSRALVKTMPTEQTESETPVQAPKPGTRIVRKVIKKIVIKRVPKGTLAAKKVATEPMDVDSLRPAVSVKSEEQTVVKIPELESKNSVLPSMQIEGSQCAMAVVASSGSKQEPGSNKEGMLNVQQKPETSSKAVLLRCAHKAETKSDRLVTGSHTNPLLKCKTGADVCREKELEMLTKDDAMNKPNSSTSGIKPETGSNREAISTVNKKPEMSSKGVEHKSVDKSDGLVINSKKNRSVMKEDPAVCSEKEAGMHRKDNATNNPDRKDPVTAEGLIEKQTKQKTEVFVCGLDKDTKEDVIREIFMKVGDIVEVRLKGQAGNNRGYCFIRYKEPSQAKKAISEFAQVEINGRQCVSQALESKDTIFLGNIAKAWKKEDIDTLLQKSGVENVGTITLLSDPNQPGSNYGFAFLEFDSSANAQSALKKLKRKGVLGMYEDITVAWSEPPSQHNEEVTEKVKAIYVEGIPPSWDEARMKNIFKKYGEIERIVLSRNMHSTTRRDFAFVNYATREAALLCLESFDKDNLMDNGSKVDLKVSLAKSTNRGKRKNEALQSSVVNNERSKKVKSIPKVGSSAKLVSSNRSRRSSDRTTSTNHELLHVLREQATWKQGPTYAPYMNLGGLPVIHMDANYGRYAHSRIEGSGYSASSSSRERVVPHLVGSSHPYAQSQSVVYPAGTVYGMPGYTSSMQRQPGFPPSGSRQYRKY